MKKMADDKNLYFISILARAIESRDQKGAMVKAFDEIIRLGDQAAYKEGFRQFQAFVKAAIKSSGKTPDGKIQFIEDATYKIIFDLVTDTFEGNEEQKQNFINALKSSSRWNTEFERIKNEAKACLPPDSSIEVEIIKNGQAFYSSPFSTNALSIGHIFPGKYTIRLSNGRVLWEGDLTRDDVIWAYAYPEQDLAMAAETEAFEQAPTRIIPLLEGELTMHVFAGLESGRITLKIEKRT